MSYNERCATLGDVVICFLTTGGYVLFVNWDLAEWDLAVDVTAIVERLVVV